MAARRLLPLFFAAFAVGPIPACITVSSATPFEPAPVAPKKVPGSTVFASFPKRPGEVVPKHPELVASKLTAPEPAEPTEPVSVPVIDQAVVPAVAIPSAMEPPLVAALRAYLENHPEDAIKHLSVLDRASQDYALALMPLLVRGSQLTSTNVNPEEAAVVVDQLHGLASRLESKAALKVEKLVFCRTVKGFGQYEPWVEGQPYKPNDLALLYVELKNVVCEPAAGPAGEAFVSRVNLSLELRDATGKLVDQTDPKDFRRRVPVGRYDHADHTRSPLHDYSRTWRISVPTQPGVYTASVEVKDASGRRVARSQPVEFRVAGP